MSTYLLRMIEKKLFISNFQLKQGILYEKMRRKWPLSDYLLIFDKLFLFTPKKVTSNVAFRKKRQKVV